MPDYSKISRPGLIPVKIENQSSLITTQVNKINFSGTGVVASVGDFNDVTIQINSGGSINTGSLLTNATFSNPNLTFTRGNGTSFNVNLITLVPTSASYALSSSFAATASSADTFIVRNQLTASGLNYPTADNGEFSFIQTDGNGNLSLQYVNTLYEKIKNGEATTIVKGTPVYVSGSLGANSIVYRADAGNPLKMPVSYISADNIASGTTGRGIALGLITGVDTTGYPAGTEVYVAVGGGWTAVRPTGSAIVQILGIVTKEGNGGQGVVLNPGPANLPNLPSGSVWVGNSGSFPTPVPTSSLNVASASFASTSSFPWFQTGSNIAYVGGNVGIAVTTPTSRLQVRGSGTTSATTTLLIQNSNTSASLQVKDDGSTLLSSPLSDATRVIDVQSGKFFVQANGFIQLNNLAINGGSSQFRSLVGYDLDLQSAPGRKITLQNINYTPASAVTVDSISVIPNFSTSANAIFNLLNLQPTITQTGGANGITRGLFINPTLTSAFDYRAIETTAGKVIFNGGNVGIRTTTPSASLDVSGSARITNGLTVTGSLISPSITGSLLGTASFATSASQATSSSFSTSASYALSASYAPSTPAFPYTGSAEITGSLTVDGSILTSGSVTVQGGAIGVVSTGTTSGTEAFKVQNATPEVLFNLKDDGEININTTKYPLNGVLTNTGGIVTEVAGWSGVININTVPPVSIFVTNGIITNVI